MWSLICCFLSEFPGRLIGDGSLETHHLGFPPQHESTGRGRSRAVSIEVLVRSVSENGEREQGGEQHYSSHCAVPLNSSPSRILLQPIVSQADIARKGPCADENIICLRRE